MTYVPPIETQQKLANMHNVTPVAEAGVWMSELKERVEHFTDEAERTYQPAGFHKTSIIFNLVSGALNAAVIAMPGVSSLVSLAALAAGYGTVGLGGIGSTIASSGSKPFVAEAEKLKEDLTKIAEEAGAEVPQGTLEAVDQFAGNMQALHKYSTKDLISKAAIFTAALGAGFYFAPVAMAGLSVGITALNIGQAFYNARCVPVASSMREAGNAIKSGLADLGEKLMEKRGASLPSPAPTIV